MPGPHDSGACACACCKIYHFHFAVVFIIFILIFLGCGAFISLSSRITLESLCCVANACLYAFTPSSRKERTLSGIFLSLLAAVIVLYAANYKRSNATVVVMSVCNLLALAVYCIWKLRSRGCTEAPAADAEVPLAPVQEEARCRAPGAGAGAADHDPHRATATQVHVQRDPSRHRRLRYHGGSRRLRLWLMRIYSSQFICVEVN